MHYPPLCLLRQACYLHADAISTRDAPGQEELLREAFKHCKPIAAAGDALQLLADLPGIALAAEDGHVASDQGVVTARRINTSLMDDVKSAVGGAKGVDASQPTTAFLEAVAQHRFWSRRIDSVPA